MRTDTPQTIYLKDYTKPPYMIEHVDLTFKIFDGHTIVQSDLKITRQDGTKDGEPLMLHGEHLKLLSIAINNGTALSESDYQLDNKSLSITPPNTDEFSIQIETEIVPETNTRLEGVYKSGGTYCTQCEAEGFRSITYFQDRPDVMATYMVRIEADKAGCPVLLSNGNLIEAGDLADDTNRHYAIWHDPFVKPAYLFALVAGDLVHIEDTFKTKSGREVVLRIYVRDGDQDQCDWAMESLKQSMKWDENVYGLEYDLDIFNIVAVSDFNMGAMENKSLNIFNTALVLAHQDTATDTDFERVEAVIAHEYFHNWSGNRVTCRDWFQLSLKEGLTVFRDQEFSSDLNSRGVKRIDDVDLLRRHQFVEDAGPMSHPVRPDNYIEINNFYTVTVYEKGAEVIRMQHTLLGAEAYRKGTDLYFERHDGQAVTCEDFVTCMSEASGVDLDQFFLWYLQGGTPQVDVKTEYNQDAETLTLHMSQSIPDTPGQSDKKPMHIPVKTALISEDGSEVATEQILHLKEKEQSFTFENITSKAVPSILRGFSAPVKLTSDLSLSDLRFLMLHDTDGFNRWESGQKYISQMIHDILDAREAGNNQEIWPEFIESFGALLDKSMDEAEDKALSARAITLPGISVLAQDRKAANPSMINDVLTDITNTLSNHYKTKLLSLYSANRSADSFENTANARAKRRLQNTVLLYLGALNDNDGASIAREQYSAANNMTDRVAALSVLTDMDEEFKSDLFADYYNRFKDYELVVNKWFSMQASARRSDVLNKIVSLKDHEVFNMKNPNRVRSLYSAFAMLNPAYFHDASGRGYEFLTDAIIELNSINPQIAARLLTPMRDWKTYTADRQELLKEQLQRIADQPKLSDNVYEIVTKTLAQ